MCHITKRYVSYNSEPSRKMLYRFPIRPLCDFFSRSVRLVLVAIASRRRGRVYRFIPVTLTLVHLHRGPYARLHATLAYSIVCATPIASARRGWGMFVHAYVPPRDVNHTVYILFCWIWAYLSQVALMKKCMFLIYVSIKIGWIKKTLCVNFVFSV